MPFSREAGPAMMFRLLKFALTANYPRSRVPRIGRGPRKDPWNFWLSGGGATSPGPRRPITIRGSSAPSTAFAGSGRRGCIGCKRARENTAVASQRRIFFVAQSSPVTIRMMAVSPIRNLCSGAHPARRWDVFCSRRQHFGRAYKEPRSSPPGRGSLILVISFQWAAWRALKAGSARRTWRGALIRTQAQRAG
jgi:hypothetical protein